MRRCLEDRIPYKRLLSSYVFRSFFASHRYAIRLLGKKEEYDEIIDTFRLWATSRYFHRRPIHRDVYPDMSEEIYNILFQGSICDTYFPEDVVWEDAMGYSFDDIVNAEIVRS